MAVLARTSSNFPDRQETRQKYTQLLGASFKGTYNFGGLGIDGTAIGCIKINPIEIMSEA
jgi:hypothetical protein